MKSASTVTPSGVHRWGNLRHGWRPISSSQRLLRPQSDRPSAAPSSPRTPDLPPSSHAAPGKFRALRRVLQAECLVMMTFTSTRSGHEPMSTAECAWPRPGEVRAVSPAGPGGVHGAANAASASASGSRPEAARPAGRSDELASGVAAQRLSAGPQAAQPARTVRPPRQAGGRSPGGLPLPGRCRRG